MDDWDKRFYPSVKKLCCSLQRQLEASNRFGLKMLRCFISASSLNSTIGIIQQSWRLTITVREATTDSLFPNSRHQREDTQAKSLFRKDLKGFMNSGLLRKDAEKSSPHQSWRLLFDLYQASSAIKSLLAFIRELTALSYPSVGEIHRLLKPLGFSRASIKLSAIQLCLLH